MPLAFGYPLALLIVLALFHWVGERFWLTTLLLYFPRALLAMPLPIIIAMLLTRRRRWLLPTQAFALWLIVVPLMGLEINTDKEPKPESTRLRIFTFNVHYTAQSKEFLSTLEQADADLVLLQEGGNEGASFWHQLSPKYQWRVTGEFVFGSRFPITEIFVPREISVDGRHFSPQFVRYRILTPSGPLVIYNMHPPSPRIALSSVWRQLANHDHSIDWPRAETRRQVEANTQRRLACVTALLADAQKNNAAPIIIAGDTNLPHQSWLLQRLLHRYRDVFETVGTGWGYTFPTQPLPWMRLDRILVDDRLGILNAHVSSKSVSDHAAIWAELEMSRFGAK